ncbi:MAG: putative LysR-family transcriptional regulator [Pseudonocardiales bacterium]|nr:putative LysR-family transcriptional regulator [Pseudonocardiales bacterium]
MMLNLNRLRMLCELSRQGTIAATADVLGYSAPAVSQQIALLEREAGIALLERGPRSITLTEAGRRLAARADDVLGLMAAAESEMRRLAGLEEGLIRVAAFPSAAASIAPRIFSGVASRSAGLSIRFEDLDPVRSLMALRHQQIDLAVVYDFEDRRIEPGPSVQVELLRDDPFMVCVSARSDVATSATISFESAASLPWIADGEPPAEECFALRYLASHSVVPKVIARTDDPVVLQRLIAAGVGVALLPELQLSPRHGIVAIPLVTPPAPRRILLASRVGSEASPAVRVVADVVRRLLRG